MQVGNLTSSSKNTTDSTPDRTIIPTMTGRPGLKFYMWYDSSGLILVELVEVLFEDAFSSSLKFAEQMKKMPPPTSSKVKKMNIP